MAANAGTQALHRGGTHLRPSHIPLPRQGRQPLAERQIEGEEFGQIDPATKKPYEEHGHSGLVANLESLSVEPTAATRQTALEDPQLCLVYKNDILVSMMKLERAQCYVVRENFILATQKEITPRMRVVLLDWLLSVQVRFKLLQETYQLCVDLIDRFLQNKPMARDSLQLLGVSCMHVAAKYEEMYPPSIEDYVYVTDNSCSAQQIREQEILVLKCLHYRVSRPLTIQYLRQLSAEGNADIVEHNMAKFLVDLAILDYKLASCMPSRRAAAALVLAVRILNAESHVQSCNLNRALTLFRLSPSTSSSTLRQELEALAEQLLLALRSVRKSQHKSVFEKYAGSKTFHVSVMKCIEDA